MNDQFPFGYERIAATTWAYLSSLLMLCVFFKFNRFWSVRNFDLMLIVLLAPGILLVEGGRQWAEDEARQAETLSRDRYDRGLEDLINVLETERRRQNAEDQLLLLQGDAWNARVALHLALGGDWAVDADDRPEVNEG